MNSPVTTWSNRMIKLGFYLLFSLVPLLLTPWNYELFEFNKMIGVYAITVIITAAWLIKMLAAKKLALTRTPLDIPIGLFVGSQLVSTLFSIDPHVSWFGYYSRFNGGMWSILSYTLLYYGFISNLDAFTCTETTVETKNISYSNDKKSKRERKRSLPLTQKTIIPFVHQLLTALLLTGSLVAIYGVLERLGIDKNIWVQDVQNRVFSSLGQPNWLAAYLIALMPITMAFALKFQNSKLSVFWVLITLLLFTTLLFTRSRSGLFGFAVADILFWILLFIRAKKLSSDDTQKIQKVRLTAGVLLHGAFALIVFINGTGTPMIDRYITLEGLKTVLSQTYDGQATKQSDQVIKQPVGPALEVGGTESGIIRKYVWLGALNAWRSSTKTILIGTGTETFTFAFYQFRPVGHNLTSEWDFLYNKAHNEYLNYLATTGIFGLGSYLLFIGTFIIWFIKDVRFKNKELIENTSYFLLLKSALFAGWLSILVTNFFGFSVVIMQVFLFLFPVIIIALSLSLHDTREHAIAIYTPMWVRWLIFTGSIGLLYLIGVYWYADTLFASGYQNNRAGLYTNAAPLLIAAVDALNREPTYHDELAQSYASLAAGAFENNNATQAATLAALAIRESDKAIGTSPRNVNFYKTRTKVLYTLSTLDAAYNNDAVTALKKALLLSPNDPKIYYNLAILLGRQNESDEAISFLLKAKELKATYRDVYYALHVFYLEAKKSAEANAILTEYLTNIDPNDQDFQKRIQ